MEPLSNNTEENFDRFIVEAIETGCIWALEGEEGFALCPSEKNDDIDVIISLIKQDRIILFKLRIESRTPSKIGRKRSNYKFNRKI